MKSHTGYLINSNPFIALKRLKYNSLIRQQKPT